MKTNYKLKSYTLLAICILGISFLSAQTINTFAGSAVVGYSGDGGQATLAELNGPCGIYIDANNNLFIGDETNAVLRKVNSSGVITTVAGNHHFGYSGDGGQATAAELSDDQGVCTDAAGNIYIADFSNARIRKVDLAGIITTIGGNGTPGYSGDGGAATDAELNAPSGVITDVWGDVYIADEGNRRVRMINSSGMMSTWAGIGYNGYSGDGGPATAAEISNVTGVGIDLGSSIYIADYGNCRIRKVTSSGIISTIAGNGVSNYSGDGGQATAAELSHPSGVCVDNSFRIFIADQYRVRMVGPSGIITTVAGNGDFGFSGDGGPATAAEFNYAFDVAVDVSGNLYLSDVVNARVREVNGITTAIQGPVFENNMVNLYPNPNNGKFTIQLPAIQGMSSVEVYNMGGEQVLKTTLSTLTTQIDLSDKAKGIYLYKVLSEKGELIGSGKFEVE